MGQYWRWKLTLVFHFRSEERQIIKEVIYVWLISRIFHIFTLFYPKGYNNIVHVGYWAGFKQCLIKLIILWAIARMDPRVSSKVYHFIFLGQSIYSEKQIFIMSTCTCVFFCIKWYSYDLAKSLSWRNFAVSSLSWSNFREM